MDIYTFSLTLGAVGLGVMALGGLGHGSHGAHHAHAGHGPAGHGPAGHGPAGHGAAGHAHAGHAHPGPGHAGHAHGGLHGGRDMLSSALWTLATPRVVFAALLGFGAAGTLLRPFVGGLVLFALAVIAGLAFERLVVRPLTNFLFNFATTPARTLDSTVLDEASAASGFDANGQGLVALQLDGQVVQVLGTLRPEDRALGLRIRAGDRLRIEDVDGERHRCTVSFVGRP